jgi:uncharacterized protein
MPLFILVLLSAFLVLNLLWWVMAHRWLAGLRRARVWRVCLGAFVVLMGGFLLLMVAGRAGYPQLEEWMPRWMLVSTFVWHFIGLPIATAVVLLRSNFVLLRAAFRFLTRGASSGIQTDVVEPTPVLSRRQFVLNSMAIAPPLLSIAASTAGEVQLSQFRVSRMIVPIANLPSGIDGMTIAHVSDTHIGRFTLGSKLQRIIDATNELDVDLVLQTGDLINHDHNDLPTAAEFLRGFKSRFGQFLCEGNHDLIEGRAGLEQFIRSRRLPFLIDQAANVRINDVDIDVLGLPWTRVSRRAGPANAETALADTVDRVNGRRRFGAFPILLAHHPHAFDAAATCGIPLTLSGHTHGGQLQLTSSIGFGPLMYRYWSGLYRNGASNLVVSNGTGNWFPLRINAPAEVIHITLKRDA